MQDECIVLTRELFDAGLSERGGTSLRQLAALGLSGGWKTGWKQKIIGKVIKKTAYDEYLSLRDGRPRNTSNGLGLNLLQETRKIPWADQYQHPNWQRIKCSVLIRDKFTCRICGEVKKQLHVHHLKYEQKKYIWEIDLKYLFTLCDDCHNKVHDGKLKI
jgi:5-methylcytosine-specific restriction endonuclease McrA